MHDPFGRSRLPPDFSREGRIRLLRDFADAILDGREPPPEAQTFLAGAISAYLDRGGDLARDYLRITPPRGSHKTPKALARHRDEGEESGYERSSGDQDSPRASA